MKKEIRQGKFKQIVAASELTRPSTEGERDFLLIDAVELLGSEADEKFNRRIDTSPKIGGAGLVVRKAWRWCSGQASGREFCGVVGPLDLA